MKVVKTLAIAIVISIIVTAAIFVGCIASPKFRNAYTDFMNGYEVRVHDVIEKNTGVDIPYTQYDKKGNIVWIK